MFISYILIFFFFFFQAEDGIRDLTVTGVQTCALPISRERALERRERSQLSAVDAVQRRDVLEALHRWRGHRTARGVDCLEHRSEERRVGKECRSRWSAYH